MAAPRDRGTSGPRRGRPRQGGRDARLVVADVLAENVAAWQLFASVFPDHTAVEDGPEIQLTAALTGADCGRSAS